MGLAPSQGNGEVRFQPARSQKVGQISTGVDSEDQKGVGLGGWIRFTGHFDVNGASLVAFKIIPTLHCCCARQRTNWY
jgi:hypothetical protein